MLLYSPTVSAISSNPGTLSDSGDSSTIRSGSSIASRPFDGAQGVLQYLGRYTHRIAISNNRILNIQNGNVSFLWRDYADQNRQKTMTLKADEFIRRFLLHVLPSRYVRIRHFGLLANRNRKDNIALCRKILGDGKTVTQENNQTGDLAGTVAQNLRDRCHPLSRMSERKNVQGGAAASLSMQQPLAVEMNPMNKATNKRLRLPAKMTSCFATAPYCQKSRIPRSSRPSVGLFVNDIGARNKPVSLQKG